jgi:hypothetical protein
LCGKLGDRDAAVKPDRPIPVKITSLGPLGNPTAFPGQVVFFGCRGAGSTVFLAGVRGIVASGLTKVSPKTRFLIAETLMNLVVPAAQKT